MLGLLGLGGMLGSGKFPGLGDIPGLPDMGEIMEKVKKVVMLIIGVILFSKLFKFIFPKKTIADQMAEMQMAQMEMDYARQKYNSEY